MILDKGAGMLSGNYDGEGGGGAFIEYINVLQNRRPFIDNIALYQIGGAFGAKPP